MFDFFYFVVFKKPKVSSEDSANGGCGDKNLTGMAFVNGTRVHRVILREGVMGVRGGRPGCGGSGKGLIGKWHSIVNNTIKYRLIKITGF
jgi:hypothetical protein